MYRDLLNTDEFYVFTFPSTQTALQAEKILENEGLSFILIPTPREVSASCGLAVKCLPQNMDSIKELLAKKGINYSDVHYLNRKH